MPALNTKRHAAIAVTQADGTEVHATPQPDSTLARALWVEGPATLTAVAPPLCAGLGRCGRCAVRFVQGAPTPQPGETEVLGESRMAEGWRLACRHVARPGMTVELPAPDDTGWMDSAPTIPDGDLLLALDLGTTSLAWEAGVLEAGAWRTVALGGRSNPQCGAGAEVMSRLAYAVTPGGRDRLRELVEAVVVDVVNYLPQPPKALCLAANPAMTALALGLDASGLAAAPYHLPVGLEGGHAGHTLAGLPTRILPQLAPFVGGDVCAGLAWLLAQRPAFPFLLADLGTNGEFVLATGPQDLAVASVPLGPALEGVGLSHGRLAAPGVATAFELTPHGLKPELLGDAKTARGIAGTGYLSLLRRLLDAGLLTSQGRFADSPEGLAHRLAREFVEGPGGRRLRLPLLGEGFALHGGDVEAVMQVKAAFSLAVEKLLAATGLRAGDVKNLYLAGAVGEHVAPEDLEALGFLPPGLARRTRAVGNASLRGAMLMLARPEHAEAAAVLARHARVLGLAEDPGFQAAYVERMVFAHV